MSSMSPKEKSVSRLRGLIINQVIMDDYAEEEIPNLPLERNPYEPNPKVNGGTNNRRSEKGRDQDAVKVG